MVFAAASTAAPGGRRIGASRGRLAATAASSWRAASRRTTWLKPSPRRGPLPWTLPAAWNRAPGRKIPRALRALMREVQVAKPPIADGSLHRGKAINEHEQYKLGLTFAGASAPTAAATSRRRWWLRSKSSSAPTPRLAPTPVSSANSISCCRISPAGPRRCNLPSA